MTEPNLNHDAWRYYTQAQSALEAVQKLMAECRNHASAEAPLRLPAELVRDMHKQVGIFQRKFELLAHAQNMTASIRESAKGGRS